MAISFSRPDPSSPAAVGSAAFSSSRRGFDPSEVREFLRMVAAEMARLQEREHFLEGELRAIQTSGMSAPGRLDEETVITLLGEEAARVLSTAREASIQIRDRAEESATRMVKDAAQDAGRIREQAALDAKGIRDDSQSDANSEIELAKQQGRDMVEEARAYREKVLSELLRRRDAAREQIEQLLHGRDRLMNAFERARLATEDVLGGLSDAHEDPEFLVNLAPTTGPVPPVIAVAPHVSQEHPSLGIFDHDTASIVMPTQTVVEEIAQEEIAQEEIAQEEESSPVEPLEKMAKVVSIFGGSRRSHPTPEITNDDKAESHVEIEKEISSPEPETKSPGAQVVDDIFARLRASSPAEVAKNITKEAKDTKEAKESIIKLVKSPPKKPIAITPILDAQKFSDRDASIAPLIVNMSKKTEACRC